MRNRHEDERYDERDWDRGGGAESDYNREGFYGGGRPGAGRRPFGGERGWGAQEQRSGGGGGYPGFDRDWSPGNFRQSSAGRFGGYGSSMGAGGGMSSYASTGGRFAGKGPKGYRRSDERIREDVNEWLTDHPDIDATEVEEAVENGEVTLTGMVDDRHAKRLAEDIAESVPGVREVRNQLRVQHLLRER